MRYNKYQKEVIITTRHQKYRNRRILAAVALVASLVGFVIANPSSYENVLIPSTNAEDLDAENRDFSASEQGNAENSDEVLADGQIFARTLLEKLEIKGRAPKTGYKRDEFYSGWPDIDGCSLRQRIIKRELNASATLAEDNCTVIGGEFDEPYTGSHLVFYQKSDFTTGIQIDHVVALSDAWQKGAQYFDRDTRYNIATDPLNLLAVDAKANQGKSDGDAATWLPPNKAFRCQYVARQVSVKYKYQLWVTQAEHDAIAKVLETCPNEPAVGIEHL